MPLTSDSPVRGVMTSADSMSPQQLVDHVLRLESLGFDSVWLPDVYGREIYITAGHILANTSRIRVASGIAHIYGRDAVASTQAARTLSEFSNGRFIQGLGVSHPIAAQMRNLEWENPIEKMTAYLTAMRGKLPLHTPKNPPPTPVYIAAHGPKMMAVAAALADGANTYMQPPAHTAESRNTLGPNKTLNVLLPCCLTNDPDAARAAGRRALSIYLPLPAYQRQWAHFGFNEYDWANGGSNKLVDAFIPWGDAETIRNSMSHHIEAGASNIILTALNPDPVSREVPWDILEALAPR